MRVCDTSEARVQFGRDSGAAFGVKSDYGLNLKCLVTTQNIDFRRIKSPKSGFWRSRVGDVFAGID